jgi:hypothetical protein
MCYKVGPSCRPRSRRPRTGTGALERAGTAYHRIPKWRRVCCESAFFPCSCPQADSGFLVKAGDSLRLPRHIYLSQSHRRQTRPMMACWFVGLEPLAIPFDLLVECNDNLDMQYGFLPRLCRKRGRFYADQDHFWWPPSANRGEGLHSRVPRCLFTRIMK